MRYYVVSDTHGYYDYLIKSLEEAGFFEDTEPHKLVLCGDLLDRGGQARELIDFMMQLIKQDKLIYILGNHEELLVQCLQQISRGEVYGIAKGMSHHYTNGTWDTLLQIAQMHPADACAAPDDLLKRVIRSEFYRILLPAAVDYYETDNYIFVHGWIPCHTGFGKNGMTYEYDPDWRNAYIDEWKQARWLNGMELACRHSVIEPAKTVICGHYHASYGHSVINDSCSEYGADADFSPFYADGIIAIDACAAASGKINCVVVED